MGAKPERQASLLSSCIYAIPANIVVQVPAKGGGQV